MVRTINFVSLLVSALTLSFAPSIKAQSLVIIQCPPGYLQAGPNLCIQERPTGEKGKIYHYTDRRVTENKTIVEAQIQCRSMGAHVCTYDEIAEGWDQVKPDLAAYDMLGNQGADDYHLCVNNPNDKMNFEGSCHKHYRLRYRCCMSVQGMPGMFGGM